MFHFGWVHWSETPSLCIAMSYAAACSILYCVCIFCGVVLVAFSLLCCSFCVGMCVHAQALVVMFYHLLGFPSTCPVSHEICLPAKLLMTDYTLRDIPDDMLEAWASKVNQVWQSVCRRNIHLMPRPRILIYGPVAGLSWWLTSGCGFHGFPSLTHCSGALQFCGPSASHCQPSG